MTWFLTASATCSLYQRLVLTFYHLRIKVLTPIKREKAGVHPELIWRIFTASNLKRPMTKMACNHFFKSTLISCFKFHFSVMRMLTDFIIWHRYMYLLKFWLHVMIWGWREGEEACWLTLKVRSQRIGFRCLPLSVRLESSHYLLFTMQKKYSSTLTG